MKIRPFALERYFARHEFSAPFLLSCSDAEPLTLKELLDLADNETRELWEHMSLGYTESQGHPLLLDEISAIYQNIPASNIIEVIPEEGIFIAMNILLDSQDHVITTHPGYQSLSEIAVSIGCQVSKWSPDFKGEMRFSVQDLHHMIQENTKLIVINFPHNPTGALLTRSEFEKVAAIARENNIIIFSDEMYRNTEFDPALRLPSMCEIYENSVALSGLSKSFALPGLRVGWLASQKLDLIEKVKLFKDYTTICASTPGEILAIIALRAREIILNRTRAIVRRNLQVLDDFFAAHERIFAWQRPSAGTIGFPELLLDLPVDDFCQKLLEEKGIMLVPASVIGHQSNHFRIGFGRENMPEVLQKLETFIQEMKYI